MFARSALHCTARVSGSESPLLDERTRWRDGIACNAAGSNTRNQSGHWLTTPCSWMRLLKEKNEKLYKLIFLLAERQLSCMHYMNRGDYTGSGFVCEQEHSYKHKFMCDRSSGIQILQCWRNQITALPTRLEFILFENCPSLNGINILIDHFRIHFKLFSAISFGQSAFQI